MIRFAEIVPILAALLIWAIPIVLIICSFVMLKRIREDQKEVKRRLDELERSLKSSAPQ